MENNEPIANETESQEVQVPSDGRKEKLATWIRFPRRVVFLLIAFGLAHALIAALRGPMAAASVDPLMTPEAQTQIEGAIRQGELVSIATGEPVSEMVAEYLPNTLTLVGAALLLALILAAVATLIAVLAHWLEERFGPIGSILKGLGRLFAFGPASLPVFCLGIVLIFLFAFRLGWLPMMGMIDPGGPDSFGVRAQHLILPALTLAILPAVLTAQTVSRELTLPREDGGSRLLLIGLLKTLGTLLGQIGGLLSAAVLVELIFAWPGIGRLLANSVMRRDYPLLLGTLAAYPILVLVGRLLSELFRWFGRLVEGSAPPPESAEKGSWRGIARGVWTAVGVLLLVIPLALAIGGLIAPPDVEYQVSIEGRLQPPSAQHLLGTDEIGRDVMAMMLRGGSVDLGITGLATGIVFLPSLIGGALLGFLASRRTWWAESIADLLLLPADILLYIPIIPSGILLWTLLVGESQQSTTAALALVAAIALLPRVVRLYPPLWEAVPERRKWLRIALAGPGIVFLGSLFGGFWIASSLDFMGFGIAPPTPSLGRMIGSLFVFLYQGTPTVLYVIAALWLCAFALYTAADALVGFFWTKEPLARLNE
jgi:peptide/nickel transport system permease protein